MSNVRRTRLLAVGAVIGLLAALVPAVAGPVFADQPPTAPPATATMTVVTDNSWLVSGGPTTAMDECANASWTFPIPQGASWIWAPFEGYNCNSGPSTAPVGQVTLSTTFNVPGDPQGATLQFAVDNTGSVYINGTDVADLQTYGYETFQTGFSQALTEVPLVQGTNTITIVASNATGSCSGASTYCNPAGALAALTVSYTLDSTSLCKDGGWMQWTDPVFTNQGDCVSYVVSHGNDPSQG